MYVLSSDEIKAWDEYTIENEPISSINLMERAAQNFVGWFTKNFFDTNRQIVVLCGTGNNGGDGLAIARMLSKKFYTVHVIICHITQHKTKDFIENLERIKLRDVSSIQELNAKDTFTDIHPKSIIIDALLGIGFNRPIDDTWKQLFKKINSLTQTKISIDIPSGLSHDGFGNEDTIKADYTITFQVPKLSFFFAENEKYVGIWHVIPIGLDERFLLNKDFNINYIQHSDIQNLLIKRSKFSHKGNFGHSLIIGGQNGMMGAMVLAVKAAYRSGVGIVTAHIPKIGYSILQTSIPEAIIKLDSDENNISEYKLDESYNAVGIGCGMGTSSQSLNALKKYIESSNKIVIDADGLNCIAKIGIDRIKFKENTIITPHPKEFSRLFGDTKNSYERIKLAIEKANQYNIIIVLKGANTTIVFPNIEIYFNSTGNAGMATAGSGDVLTGILVGLLSRGYSQKEAVMLGVYLHGLAGDLAKECIGMESLMASDIIENISSAFKKLYS